MRCWHATCDNEARYIDEDGCMVCGTCPLKYGNDSIKIADVPKLLAWARALLANQPKFERWPEALADLRDIVQRAVD